MVAVKICGITSARDAQLALEAGADAIGLNFYAGSARCVDVGVARDIVRAVGDRVLTVGVFVDAEFDEIDAIRQDSGVRCVQLHGSEPPELLARLLPHAYKALRVRGADVLQEAERFGGEHILLDAYVPGQAGGTGRRFDWELARMLAERRNVTLAGGLTPDNVSEAVARVRPFCVDVASGVEPDSGADPRKKDPQRVRAFVHNAKNPASSAR